MTNEEFKIKKTDLKDLMGNLARHLIGEHECATRIIDRNDVFEDNCPKDVSVEELINEMVEAASLDIFPLNIFPFESNSKGETK